MKIELRSVSKSFDKHEALRGIDLVVPHGQRVALVGPNGSGKSTLLRVVMGLVAPTAGEVRLDGMSPFHARETLAHHMAYVPQVAPQLGATVREVIRAVTTLRVLPEDAVHSFAARLDLDTRAIADKPFRSLSGGMKHKLLLAAALTSGATLLILDEPTASLDVATRERFGVLLDEAARDATVLLCSHRLEEVHQQRATRVVELGDGRVVRDLAAVAGRPRPGALEEAS